MCDGMYFGPKKKTVEAVLRETARGFLEQGRARGHRIVPFPIRLGDRLQEDSVLKPLRLKLDPGSKTTGAAVVREWETVDGTTGEVSRSGCS